MILLLSFGRGQAQCNAYYQAFESFGGVISGSTGGAGLVQGVTGTNYWTINGYTNSTSSYGGSAAAQLSSTGYIITPKIAKLKDFSFWYRRTGLGTVNTTSFAVEYSTNYDGTNIASGTWTLIQNVTSPASTAYTQFLSATLNINNVYIRIRQISSTATTIIDNLGWSSVDEINNTQIVLAKGTGTCTTNLPLLSNVPYTFYDNGGETDTYNISQDQTLVFTPANGERIKLEFISNDAGTSSVTYTLSNVLPALAATTYTSTSTMPTGSPYYSDYCQTATIRYQTAGGLTAVAAGFKIRVTSEPVAACSGAVSVPTVPSATIAYNAATITWGNLTGCTAPAGYDYYVSTTPGTPPGGVLTPSNTTALQAGYVFNSGVNITGATVTGLQGSTLYYGWVRRNCTGTYGAWTPITNTGGSFTTLCTPVPAPYIEDFQASAVALPACTSTNSGSSGISTVAGNNYFFNTSTGTWIFSKPLALDPTKIYRLSFDYGNSANQATVIEAYYGRTDYTVSSTATTSSLVSVSTSNNVFATSKSYFQPSSASTYYIGIKIQSIAGGAMILDNIKVEEVPCWPGANPVISGPTGSCPGLSVTYTATGPAFAGNITANGVANKTTATTQFTWGAPTGWLVTGGQGTNSATVTTGISPGNIWATGDLSGCDSSYPSNFPVTSAAIPLQPSTITGSTGFCTLPSTGLIYSVTNSAASYVWSFPSGWTITAGANTNSVTVTATAGAVSGTVSVTPYNGPSGTGCAGTPRTLTVSVGAVTNNTFGTAATITSTSTDSFRCGLRHFWYAYTVPATCGGTYKINLSGNGGDIDLYVYPASPTIANTIPATTAGTITGGSSLGATATESATVNLTAGSTYYILVYSYVAPDGGGTFNLAVTSQSVGTPGPIAGSGSVSCSSITTTNYSVPAVSGASTYTWTVPAGWTINSGQGTTSINITTSGTTGGTLSVIASGVCGISVPATKTITVGQIQPDVISGPAQLCSPFTATTYSIDLVPGATSYIWTLPTGWTGTSTTTSITVTPSSTSGTIRVVAVGPCGNSPATTLAVATASAVTTTPASVCIGGTGSLSSVINPVTTFPMSNVPTSGAPTFVRSYGGTTYNSSGTTVAYTTTTITTVATGAGSYVFDGCASGDTFLHIYDTTFNPATPAVNFLAANDDGNGANCTLDPRITITLLANHSYVLVYSTYNSVTSGITGITVNVTPPSGVAGIQFGATDWYIANTGGSPIYSGNTFNPVGVAGSGLANTNTAGTYTFYATNSLSSFCRTATNFVVNPRPTAVLSTGNINVCPNSVTPLTVSGTGNTYTWTSSVAGTLFSNAAGTVAYVPLTNATTVYVRNTAVNTITVTGTITATSCTFTNSVTYTPTSATKTWDGVAWSPAGAPTMNESIVFVDDWSGGSLSGCSCQVVNGSVVTFHAEQTLTLANALDSTDGTVIFENNSTLLQINNVANTGNITYVRDSTPVYKFDYTYWSTPVSPQTLFGVSDSPYYFEYNSSLATPNWVAVNSATTMTPGKGYIIRAPANYPVGPVFPPPILYTASFTGVPNNGPYSVPVYGGANQLNLLGNPYPSAIDASLLVTDPANSSILDGTIYFWTHNTPINANYQYTGSDYAVWNILGGVNTHPATNPGLNNNTPNGFISAGQGFFVKGLSNGNAVFKNSMRVPNGIGVNQTNNQFFRTNATVTNRTEIEKHRIWLDISNTEGAYKQVLVGYMEGATLGLDRSFDGEMVDIGNVITLYTLVEDKKLSIQGRGLPFNTADIIPLGYKSTISGTYSIKLSDFDGLFVGQDIYLEDRVTHVIHNLKTGAYSFTTTEGTFENRFLLRFTNETLGVIDVDANSVVVFNNALGLHISSGNLLMKNVKLFDVTGRLIAFRDNINDSKALFATLPRTQQVVLVLITTETGEKVTKKVIF